MQSRCPKRHHAPWYGCMHTCYTYIQTYIHTYIHTRPYVRTYNLQYPSHETRRNPAGILRKPQKPLPPIQHALRPRPLRRLLHLLQQLIVVFRIRRRLHHLVGQGVLFPHTHASHPSAQFSSFHFIYSKTEQNRSLSSSRPLYSHRI